LKLYFIEAGVDYKKYNFPYIIIAEPESEKEILKLFEKGFLPYNHNLTQFYLCRNIRIKLSEFTPSSENRRILRKGEGISFKLKKRNEFKFNDNWLKFCKDYADQRFGKDIMSESRLLSLFHSPVTSHIMEFYNDNQIIGIVVLYIIEKQLTYYYYSFYDLKYFNKNLGMYMMTSAVKYFSENNFQYIYLGTCYSKNALYKTQFKGMEFFNGRYWSSNLKELKFLIKNYANNEIKNVFEIDEYSKYTNKSQTIFSGGLI